MEVTQKPCLHQEWIDPEALDIVRLLQDRGFTTYLVGGCVRDLLLNKQPKDYDIATDARPGDVRRQIRNAFIIGKRFRLVLVKRGDQQFEVATFRRDLKTDEVLPDHIESGDNLFGSPEEDANRRDFTINGLMYDPISNKLLDFCGGLGDLKNQTIRTIGEPNRRFKEDPIRILRGIRLAHLIRFNIDPEVREAIQANAASLADTALPRRREEILKYLRIADPAQPFLESYDLGVLKYMSPHLHEVFSHKESADLFCHYLSHIHDKPIDQSDPVQLFGALVQAYYRATINPDPNRTISTNQILENPDMISLMRGEVGMFKQEQGMVAKALHMQSILRKRADFERRGERRQMAVLQTEAFHLALQFSSREYSLSGEDWLYWAQNFEKSRDKIGEAQIKSRRNRWRSNRRRTERKPQEL
ncbi:MAG: poly(A) polymerase [Bdellovibrionales bacterium]|nr:poly(A) polymerase [Bdellovibrionales bacterium]